MIFKKKGFPLDVVRVLLGVGMIGHLILQVLGPAVENDI